ncbi:hypothetical protein EDB84DRAFT_1673610 [Lactarius hengduanensis]|nr:hypothetical protein EDB84DRAFT_1673610 [Lactarius hengduanensis]
MHGFNVPMTGVIFFGVAFSFLHLGPVVTAMKRSGATLSYSGFPAFFASQMYRDTFSTVYRDRASCRFYSVAAHRWAGPKLPLVHNARIRRAPTAVGPNRPLTNPKSGS